MLLMMMMTTTMEMTTMVMTTTKETRMWQIVCLLDLLVAYGGAPRDGDDWAKDTVDGARKEQKGQIEGRTCRSWNTLERVRPFQPQDLPSSLRSWNAFEMCD